MAGQARRTLLIEQGYLVGARGVSLRVRKTTDMGKVVHTFNFKLTADSRVVEVEQEIEERDFEDIWPSCMNKLHKVRYVCWRPAWEIDFFKDHDDQTYFCLAEHEMPEGRERPLSLPPLVEENLVYSVSSGDGRFSSKALSDIRHAKGLLRKLLAKELVPA